MGIFGSFKCKNEAADLGRFQEQDNVENCALLA